MNIAAGTVTVAVVSMIETVTVFFDSGIWRSGGDCAFAMVTWFLMLFEKFNQFFGVLSYCGP
jgi:hypothetical protein